MGENALNIYLALHSLPIIPSLIESGALEDEKKEY